MENDEIENLLQNQFKGLPESLRNTIVDSNFKISVDLIATKHGITDETKRELLKLETLFILAGVQPTKSYLRNLQKSLELPEETVRQVGREVNETVFKPVAEDLKKLQEEMEENKTVGVKNPPSENKEVEIPIPIKKEIVPPNLPPNLPTVDQGTVPIKNIVDEKLNTVVKLPREEKFIDNMNKFAGYKGEDPYREPLE